MAATEIEQLVRVLKRVPGLGPRSATRAVLALLKRRDTLLQPLLAALASCAEHVAVCRRCGNLDTIDPCGICADASRDPGIIAVVEEVEDLWAMERAAIFDGRYHVLGGTLSAAGGIGPDELGIDRLVERIAEGGVSEILLALGATVDGQTTGHYLIERLRASHVKISRLGYGLPVGGALNYLDEGTLMAAMRSRQSVE